MFALETLAPARSMAPFSCPVPPNPEQTRWFVEEVQQHEAALRSYLYVRFPGIRDIDDVIQETYARFFRACRSIKVEQPRAYLFRTARNVVIDLYRRPGIASSKDLGEIDVESVVEKGPNPAESASHDYDLEILGDAIGSLPERCRIVLQLCRFQGLSYREIGQILGISEKTVSSQLAIAMVRCRQYFRTRGELNRRRHASHT